jgi:hypothetical protein
MNETSIVKRGTSVIANQSFYIRNPLIHELMFRVIEMPLIALYLHGPQWGGYGFWAGANNEDICATLTAVPAYHWATNEVVCSELIYNKFYSYMIGVYAIIYIGTMISLYMHCVRHIFTVNFWCCCNKSHKQLLID